MLTQVAALAIDLIALVIIGFAAVRTFVFYVVALVRQEDIRAVDRVRLSLGRSLVLGLEFLIGSDILRTAVAPSWSVIGQLAAIVLLRTLLDYFLERELETILKRETAEGKMPRL